MRLTEKGRAAWVLAILSPAIAELLSGSSPPMKFFLPTSFALLLALYGGGVLLVRELSVIWNRGWASVIVMGAAYGILEEGVAVKSFFDPHWKDLGGLGVYGRALGTNWVWAAWLTEFHSMISITLPILLVALLYPNLARTRLLSRRQFELVLSFLFLDVLVCTTLLNPYIPFWPMYALAVASVFGLVFCAKSLPKRYLSPASQSPSWSPRRFFVLGLVLILSSFVISGAFVKTMVPPEVPIAAIALIAWLSIVSIIRHIGTGGNRPQSVAFASGLLSFFILLDVLLQLGGVLGMGVVALVTALAVMDLNRWARDRRVLVFRVHKLLHGAPGESVPGNAGA